jgi:hypothetical protein
VCDLLQGYIKKHAIVSTSQQLRSTKRKSGTPEPASQSVMTKCREEESLPNKSISNSNPLCSHNHVTTFVWG